MFQGKMLTKATFSFDVITGSPFQVLLLGHVSRYGSTDNVVQIGDAAWGCLFEPAIVWDVFILDEVSKLLTPTFLISQYHQEMKTKHRVTALSVSELSMLN